MTGGGETPMVTADSGQATKMAGGQAAQTTGGQAVTTANDGNDTGSPWFRVKRALRAVHVEPFVCCYVLSRTLMMLATQNLSLQKACRVNLRLANDTCTALADISGTSGGGGGDGGSSATAAALRVADEVATQRLVADMLVWQLVVQSSVPCVLAVFVGSWSDRNRRRVPCMLAPVAGELVRVVGLLACVHFFDALPMEAVGLVEALPTSLAGGRMVLFNAVFSYVGDVTSEQFKTLRFGIINLLSTASMAVGTALSGVMFRVLDFYGVYVTTAVLYTLGLLYGWIFVKEVPANPPDAATATCKTHDDGGGKVYNGFFDAQHVKEAFRVTFKEGPHNRKLRISMLMWIAFLIMGPMNGDLSVAYLNTRVRFKWNEVNFSVFSTYSMVTNVAGTAICIGLFSHVLKIDDSLIGVMACVGKIIAGFCYGLATNEWVYYLGPLVDIMGGTIFITARSIMAKIVRSDELGQVTAIYGIVESLVPIVFGPLYTVIYKNTVNTLPGAYSLIGSMLAIPATIIYLWMYKESKKSRKYEYELTKVNDKKFEELKDT